MHNFFNKLTARRRLVITERLKRLPCWGHPALRVSFRLEGTAGYVFGCRAGPSISFEHLVHELAHAVQFGAVAYVKRVSINGAYMFNNRAVTVLGRRFIEPLTGQSTRRELETIAIQARLMELAGVRVDPAAYARQAADTIQYLPDWHEFEAEAKVKGQTKLEHVTALLTEFYARWDQARIEAGLLAWLRKQELRLRRPKAQQHVGQADISFPHPPQRP